MAQITCKYHPDVPARWACRQCNINFCTNCIAERGTAVPECPVCKRQVESLGSANLITPFWERIPRFFSFPAHPGPLILMLILATLMGLLIQLPIIGLITFIGCQVVFLKYAYVVLENTAHGHLKPKAISSEDLTHELELPFKQILLIFALVAANFAIFDLFGPFIFWITLIITIISFPACTMVLAMEHSFFSAFNPVMVGTVMRQIGLPYIILCIFLSFLMGGSNIVMNILVDYIPRSLYISTSSFMSNYFTLIMFHMMGYVLFQYHEKLGYELEVELDEHIQTSPRDVETPINPELRDVEILLQEGKTEEALRRLYQIIKSSPGDLEAHQRFHKLLLATGNDQAMLQHGMDYVSRLLLENKPTQAIKVYLDCYQVSHDCKPEKPRQRFELAKMLRANGHARAAVSLLNNLHGDHPSYEGIPEAYLFVSQVLCEQFNEDERAKKVLNFIIKKYPRSKYAEEASDYLRVVENLAKGG